MANILTRLWRAWRGAPSTALARTTAVDERDRLAEATVLDALRSVTHRDLLGTTWTTVASWRTYSQAAAVKKGLRESVWVYACVMKTASAIASVPWRVHVRDSRGQWGVDEMGEHPLSAFMRRPNPFWSWRDTIRIMSMSLQVGGNALLGKARVGGQLDQVTPITPTGIEVLPSRPQDDTLSHIRGYRIWRDDGRYIDVDAGDVVHAMMPDLADRYWGQSILETCMKAVDTDIEASKAQKVSLQNLFIPPGVFTFEKPAGSETAANIRKYIKTTYQGSDNAGEPLLLPSGTKYEPLNRSPKEMDFINSRKWTREEILIAFGVPAPLLGILDKANYNNSKNMVLTWWQTTVEPMIRQLEDALHTQLVWPEYGDGVRLKPDLSGVAALFPLFKEHLEAGKMLRDLGYSPNEVNERLGLGMPVLPPERDIVLVPTSLQPLSRLRDDQGGDSNSSGSNDEAEARGAVVPLR